MKLHYNPVSSYSQKAAIAFFEKNVPFTPAIVNLMAPEGRAAFEKIYPIGKVPVLEDAGKLLPEATLIIEYLDDRFPNAPPRLVSDDREVAREIRRWDRFADNYLNEPMQKIFFDGRRPEDKRDAMGVEQARALLDKAYRVLDAHLADKSFIAGDTFTMADCAAAPSLGYLRMVHPFDAHRNVAAYAGRLFERPSFQRALAEAMPILKAAGLA